LLLLLQSIHEFLSQYTSKVVFLKGNLMNPSSEIQTDFGTAQDKPALAKMVMALLDHWKLASDEQAALLGIAASNRATLARYRKGEAIGTSRDQLERVGHLLGIHKNLRLLFPQNRELAYAWITTRNRAFDNLRPVDVIKEFGFSGLLMVRFYLDKARGL
jgi:uncharacterized protein (DUF2384 family)